MTVHPIVSSERDQSCRSFSTDSRWILSRCVIVFLVWKGAETMALNEGMVQDAVNRVLRAAPGSRVIVFGSWARGDASPDSDLDILVVEPEVKNRYDEMVRLARLLGEQLVPADVIVISQSSFERWRDVPNSLAWRAAREGRLYERVA